MSAVDDRGRRSLLRVLEQRCRLRFSGAGLEQVDGDPVCILVQPPERDADTVAEIIVGGVGEDPTDTVIQAFFDRAQEIRTERCNDLDPILELVCLDPQHHPSHKQRKSARRRGVRLLNPTEFAHRGPLPPQRQLDLSDYLANQDGWLAGGSAWRYETDRYVRQQYKRFEMGAAANVHDDLIEDLLGWISLDRWLFVTLLSDAGKGKTFLMREVVRRMAQETPDVQPLLIRLTARGQQIEDIDDLVRLHLADNGGEDIEFSPEAFDSDLRHGRIALLLDGFDELVEHNTFDSASAYLHALARLARDRAKIVVAVRAQHFDDDERIAPLLKRIGQESARGDSWTVSIEDFGDEQIEDLFAKSFPDRQQVELWLPKVRDTSWLRGLARNPRMLGLIVDELRGPQAYPFGRKLEDAANGRPDALLDWLIDHWLKAEDDRYRGTTMRSVLDVADRFDGLTWLALRIWRRAGRAGDNSIGHEDLLAVGAQIVAKLAPPTARGAAPAQRGEDGFAVKEMAHALASATLLVRRGKTWGFVDATVSEYLVARHIADELPMELVVRVGRAKVPAADANFADSIKELLSRRELSALMLNVLLERNPLGAETWARWVLTTANEGTAARANAQRIQQRR